jgi:predicted RNase H-like HicB family nuclease/uncharacterized damage-inducible protein DinB
MAHVLSFPGCVCDGKSVKEAVQRIPCAIREHISWLEKNGEKGESLEFELRIKERIYGVNELGISGGKVAIFSPDYDVVSTAETDNYIRIWGHARNDLLRLTKTLSESQLKLRLNRNERSINEILRHISNADWWYVSRIVMGLEKEYPYVSQSIPEDIFQHLAATRKIVLEKLPSVSGREKKKVFVPDYFAKYTDEIWTYRKVLRRLIEHELEHILGIREILQMHSC